MPEARKHNAIKAVAKELGEKRFDSLMGGSNDGRVSLSPARVIQTIFGGNLKTIEAALQTEAKIAENKLWKKNKRNKRRNRNKV